MSRQRPFTSPQGERLLLIMQQQELRNLSALSRATGVSATRLSMATTGSRPLGERLCERLATFYGYRTAWLLTGDGPPKPHQPGDAAWRRAQGLRLHLVAQEQGLNPAELAPRLGLTVRTIREALDGHGVSAQVADAVQTHLGYRAAWLRHGDGYPLLVPPALAPLGSPVSEREATVTAAAQALVDHHAPAYLTAAERWLLIEQTALRLLHPRSFLKSTGESAEKQKDDLLK